jgi:hypothetical protein
MPELLNTESGNIFRNLSVKLRLLARSAASVTGILYVPDFDRLD